MWFNDAQASSRVEATISGATKSYYLRDMGALGTTPGPGPKKTLDVAVNSKVPCTSRGFTPLGTRNIALP